jgi:zinc and cadmium transporter
MEIFITAGVISLLSLVGVLFFGVSGKLVGTHRFIVPFAIGAFLAVAFFELIPETLHASEFYGAVSIIVGFLMFYLLSNILYTYHHHHDEQEHSDHCSATKVSAMMLLWGDSIHNVTDGVVIASAFLINPAIGFVTAIGIALHEIPQEIAEYGVLLKAGYSHKKAMLLNFVSSLSIFIGVGLSFLFIEYASQYIWMLTGVAAGNLLYIAMSDLLPGVHAEAKKSGSFIPAFIATLAGVVLVALLVQGTHTLL